MIQLFIIALLFKCLIFSLAFVSAEVPIVEEAQAEDFEQHSELNEFADRLVGAVAKVISFAYDPADIIDQNFDFEYKSIRTYSGTLSFTRGFIKDLSSLSRRDDVVLSYVNNTDFYKLTIPLRFRDIIAGYNFEMNVRGDTVNGVLHGLVDEITAEYHTEFSSSTLQTISYDFELKLGLFEIYLYINDFNSYRSLLDELTRDLMYETIANETTVIVKDLLNDAMEYVLM